MLCLGLGEVDGLVVSVLRHKVIAILTTQWHSPMPSLTLQPLLFRPLTLNVLPVNVLTFTIIDVFNLRVFIHDLRLLLSCLVVAVLLLCRLSYS